MWTDRKVFCPACLQLNEPTRIDLVASHVAVERQRPYIDEAGTCHAHITEWHVDEGICQRGHIMDIFTRVSPEWACECEMPEKDVEIRPRPWAQMVREAQEKARKDGGNPHGSS